MMNLESQELRAEEGMETQQAARHLLAVNSHTTGGVFPDMGLGRLRRRDVV